MPYTRHIRFRLFIAIVMLVGLFDVHSVSLPPAAAAEKNVAKIEAEQLAVLRSESAEENKAIACKKLAIYGSAEAVPDLAKLLPNPRLSSWSRIALEAIPGEESNEAFRNAAESLNGRLLIGVINSIGVRRDAKATPLLIEKLKDTDVEVASAAAVALGRIGNEDATKQLIATLKTAPEGLRSAVAEASILCAERLHKDNNPSKAAKIYDRIRNADVPEQRIIEATRGAILTKGEEGISILLETLHSSDPKLFQLALGTIREFPGNRIDKTLAAELNKATPERAALLIQALADRSHTVDVASLLSLAEQGDKQVRLSAITALQRVGDGSCLSVLLETATHADADLASSAKQALAVLPGENVDRQIRERLSSSKGDQYLVLLKLTGERRISAVEEVAKALESRDGAVRNAALIALGETVSLEQLPVLISQVTQQRQSSDTHVAQRALKAASVRMPDREACAAELGKALADSQDETKTSLLEIIAEVGGPRALMTLAAEAKSSDPKSQDTASRLLGTWNSVDAAPVLLELAKTGPVEKYRVRALRGYLGLARKFAMPDAQRVEMCQNALGATKRISEHKLALSVLKLHPSTAGLELAAKAAKTQALKDDATATVMAIAQKIGGKETDIAKWISSVGLEKVNLEIVKAEYGEGTKRKDVTALLRGQAQSLPLIALPAGYNTFFGGDPAPGVAKQLNVQYQINGKSGKAVFNENDVIVLPIPN